MKHLHSFNEYEKIDEGLKDWLAGALMLLSTGSAYSQVTPKVGRQDIDRKHYTSTIKKEYGEKDSVKKVVDENRLLKQGWTQIASTVDTLWNETVENAPDSIVYTISLKFDNQVLFGSGKFDVSTEISQGLDSAFQQMLDQDGILTGVDIVSSTDKTPVGPKLQSTLKGMGLSPDNAGLSKARSSSIIDYLVSGVNINGEKSPINDTLITVNNLVEKGTIDDQSSRFVYVNINFLGGKSIAIGDLIDRTPTEKTTVYWQKEYTKKRKITFNFSKIKFKLFNHGKIGNKKIKISRMIKCPTF
jgi:outer membrane protein OmpA-like peptidoglycan-associated protein